MNSKNFSKFAIVCGSILIGLTLLQITAQAQGGTKSAPVTVTNTTANPVPVTGDVTVTNTPTVDARQSGTWNVGIAGTPTVKLDTTGNTVKLDPNANTVETIRPALYQRVETANWTGQSSEAWTTNLSFSKLRVCVAHTGSQPIQINVFTLVAPSGGGSAFFLTLDAFVIPSPNTVCRVYELTGVSLQVLASNTGNNTTGLSRVFLIGERVGS